jgi:hypothetical protein
MMFAAARFALKAAAGRVCVRQESVSALPFLRHDGRSRDRGRDVSGKFGACSRFSPGHATVHAVASGSIAKA